MHLWTVSNSWYIALPTKSAGVNSQLHYSQKNFWLLVAVSNTTLVTLLAEKDEKVWFLTILVYHYKAITGADCGRLYKLLWAPLDPSICSLATIHRVNTNILIAATILVQAFPTSITCNPLEKNIEQIFETRLCSTIIAWLARIHGCFQRLSIQLRSTCPM